MINPEHPLASLVAEAEAEAARVVKVLYDVRSLEHEMREVTLSPEAEPAVMHRLIIDGQPGPWFPRYALARRGSWFASTPHHWDRLPRLFFVIPVCDHPDSLPQSPSVPSGPPATVSDPRPGVAMGSGKGSAASAAGPDIGLSPLYMLAAEIVNELAVARPGRMVPSDVERVERILRERAGDL